MSFSHYLRDSIDVLEECLKSSVLINAQELTCRLLIEAVKNNSPILICGNGGSASDAEHFAAELVCRYRTNRRAVHAIALSNSGALATAISNDLGYDKIFSRQVEGLGQKDGVFIGITTSGKSYNIINALKTAKSKDMKTIALIGNNEEKIAPYSDIVIAVPSSVTSLIQQAHLAIYHHICDCIEKSFES